MSEDPLAPPGPAAAGPNRMFTYMLLGLGIPMIITAIIGLAVIAPRIGGPNLPVNQAATETAISGQRLTAVAISQVTQQAGLATNRPPTKTAPPPPTARPTLAPATPRQQPPTPTPVVSGRETATPLGTQTGGIGFITPTPAGQLSQTGISGETGGPLILLAGFGLLLVLIGARRLRNS